MGAWKELLTKAAEGDPEAQLEIKYWYGDLYSTFEDDLAGEDDLSAFTGDPEELVRVQPVCQGE